MSEEKPGSKLKQTGTTVRDNLETACAQHPSIEFAVQSSIAISLKRIADMMQSIYFPPPPKDFIYGVPAELFPDEIRRAAIKEDFAAVDAWLDAKLRTDPEFINANRQS